MNSLYILDSFHLLTYTFIHSLFQYLLNFYLQSYVKYLTLVYWVKSKQADTSILAHTQIEIDFIVYSRKYTLVFCDMASSHSRYPLFVSVAFSSLPSCFSPVPSVQVHSPLSSLLEAAVDLCSEASGFGISEVLSFANIYTWSPTVGFFCFLLRTALWLTHSALYLHNHCHSVKHLAAVSGEHNPQSSA